jgi:hypothetical protein
LTEISGLVRSKRDSVYWVHNDSGDEARVYAVDASGRRLSSHRLPANIVAEDIEDLALEPRAGAADRIWLGDIGDNRHARDEGVLVYRFEEPALPREGSPREELPIQAVEIMRLTYPEGPRDAEALLVDPTSGELVIVSKARAGWAEVYSAPAFASRAELSAVGTLAPPLTGWDIRLVTGGDVSRDGHWIALRTYDEVFLFERAPGTRLSEALLSRPCKLQPGRETQGESIAFVEGGLGPSLVTLGEGTDVPLYVSERATLESP